MAEQNTRRNIVLAGLAFLVMALLLFFALSDPDDSDTSDALSGNTSADQPEDRTDPQGSEPSVEESPSPKPDAAAKTSNDDAADANPAKEEPATEEEEALPPEAEPFTMTINGRVVDKDNQPIEGARVEQIQDVSYGWGAGKDGKVIEPSFEAPWPKRTRGTTTTDAEGRFELKVTGYARYVDPKRGKKVDTYLVYLASREGYLPTKDRVKVQNNGEVDDVLIPLFAASVIEGHVRTPEGEPLEGINVGLKEDWNHGLSSGEGWNDEWKYETLKTRERKTQSDSEGYYRFEGIPSGSYEVIPMPAGVSSRQAYVFGTDRFKQSVKVFEETKVVDLTLEAFSTLRFKLSDPELKRVFLSLMDQGGPTAVNSYRDSRRPPFAVVADEEDVFEFHGLMSSHSDVFIKAEGYREYETPLFQPKDGVLDLGVLGLEPSLSLSGIVVDARGAPLSGAKIVMRHEPLQKKNYSTSGGYRSEPKPGEVNRYDVLLVGKKATSGDDGTFAFEDVDLGHFTLSAEHSDYVPSIIEFSWESESAAATPVRVTLKDGGSAAGTLSPAADLRGDKHDTTLMLFPLQEGGYYNTQNLNRYALERLKGLAAGIRYDQRFTVNGLAPGRWMAVAKVGEALIPAEEFEVKAGQTTEITFPMPEFGSVFGIISDVDGKPLADHRITLSTSSRGRGGNSRNTTTDSVGNYEFEALDPGTYYIWLAADLKGDGSSFDRSIPEGREVVVKPNQRVRRDVTYNPDAGVKVFGKILVNGQLYFRNVSAIAYELRGDVQRRVGSSSGAMFKEDGGYTLQFPRGGHFGLVCFGPSEVGGAARYEQEFDVPVGKSEFQYDLKLTAYSIRGQLSGDLKGLDVNSGTISARLHGDREVPLEVAKVRPLSQGLFFFPVLWPGEYTLRCDIPGRTRSEVRVSVQSDLNNYQLPVGEEGGSVKVTIKEILGVDTMGEVENPFGGGAYLEDTEGNRVGLSASGMVQRGNFLKAGESITLKDIPPGAYTLIAYSSGCMRVEQPITVVAGQVAEAFVTFQRWAMADLEFVIPGADANSDLKDLKLFFTSPKSGKESPLNQRTLTHNGGNRFTFSFPLRYEGQYTFRAEYPGCKPASVTIESVPSKHIPVTLELERE